ncbi:15918_t:CDS:2 [Acaulospora colombiana]|uniref:15918_t:CDS:1 n=1 Tax=Acaulospora colombiana TaxID=27376 RepID=A0ACA9LNF0_9GLOM|nr:15918_t:CDS:2 [Acaulospora colombiana]
MYPGQQYKQQYGSGSQQPTAQQNPQPPPYYQTPPQPYPYQPPPGGYAPSGFPTGGYAPPLGPPPTYPVPYQQYPPPPYPNPYYNNSVPYTSTPQPGVVNSTYQNYQLTGRKKALLIGINYFGSQFQLKGCINDVKNIKEFLVANYEFREENMLILTDNQSDPKKIPNRANIIAAMKWLVHDARPNDSYVMFHDTQNAIVFGHGGQVEDLDGDEDDGFDETIMPVDFQTAGQIVDDEMHDIMVRSLHKGVRLTAIFDSCHSGTALDLPYIYSTHGVVKEQNILADGGNTLMNVGMSYLRGDIEGIKTSIMAFGKKATSGRKINEQNKHTKASEADVIMFSGCKDGQTSADANEAGQNTGAMSYAFIKT